MGNALVQTLHEAGHPVTIWNRTRHRLQIDKLIELRAKFKQDAEIAIGRSGRLVMICVLDYDAIYNALDKVPSFAGKTVVNLTNGSPSQSTVAEEWFKRRQAERYFNGAVMATPELVGTAHSLLVSTTAKAKSNSAMSSLSWELWLPLTTSCPDAGSASRLDLAAFATMYGMFLGPCVGR
ncbi:oxidoreductase, putative [Metarhizium acridum CQMa 102]|uniref:Oxidoreductase, putative n=1 Tax=Metarhizium acridum (strain CQMa 102) TaxID=655827 RepID=E9DZE9_METAQ|nr:oxidoreductase, putative [Metarhizium acridum CQMa 102]EFY90881.1 oxidoreductase, putative [Metarhizium acridum CQMa 102]